MGATHMEVSALPNTTDDIIDVSATVVINAPLKRPSSDAKTPLAPVVVGAAAPREAPPPADHKPPINGFLCRQHILDATTACFDDLGYDGTTIRAIAKRLGCAVGSIYRYFADKRALLLACAERALAPVAEALAAEDATFEKSLRLYLRIADEQRELYRLLFWLADSRPAPVDHLIAAWGGALGGRAAAERAWATCHGLLMLDLSPATIAHHLTAALDGAAREAKATPLAEPGDGADDLTLL